MIHRKCFKSILTTLILSLCSLSLSTSVAQAITKSKSTKNIKGVVVDSATLSPLSYATVVLKEVEPSKQAYTSLTQTDGSFSAQGYNYKQYQLSLSYVGYKTKTIQLPLTATSAIDLGTVTLAPTSTELEEVEVSVSKPLIEQSIGKLTYNVEADPEQSILNSLDMLRKVPYLSLDADDNLQLNGNSNYQLLLNGKRSSLFAGNVSDVLKSLPASSIKEIEVITNPSAKYEASGVGGVVNIITRNKSISGYNGSVSLAGNHPTGYSGSANVSATTGKLSVAGRYNFGSNISPTSINHLTRSHYLNQLKLEQFAESDRENELHNLGGDLSYQLSPQSIIAATYSSNTSINKNIYRQLVEQRDANGALKEAYINLNKGTGKGEGHDLGVNYEHTSKRNDQQVFSVSFNSTNSTNSNEDVFELQPIFKYNARTNNAYNVDRTQEHTLQSDYTLPFGKQLLEIGVKTISEKSSSNYSFKTLDEETGAFLPDSSISNSFDYQQNIHAAYASLSLSMGKWGLRTGARFEQTELDAKFRSSGTVAKQNYHNLFPSAALSRALKGSRVSLAYNQRIERPGLYYLDPYIDQTDPLNISYGNPAVQPATNHTFQLEYSAFIKNTSLNVSATHSFTNNSIEQFTTLGADSVARTTFGNIGQNKNYALLLNGGTTLFKKISVNLSTGTSYVSYTSMLEGEPLVSEGFTYNLRAGANYRLERGWRMSGNMSYNSSNVLLQGSSSGYTWSSLSVNKQFLKDHKASISLSVRNPFREKRRNVSETINPSFYQWRESSIVVRQFSLAFNYRFGKLN